LNNIRIAPNFLLREFQCKDGSHQVVLYSGLLQRLQRLRELVARPLIISSGYRNPQHNRRVGGAPDSLHLRGMAADIFVRGMPPPVLADKARRVGFDRIIVYDSFLHVEARSPH